MFRNGSRKFQKSLEGSNCHRNKTDLVLHSVCVSPSLKRQYTGHFLTKLFTILTDFKVTAKAVSPEERLISDLLQNYTKEARPVKDPNNTIVVVFGFELVQLVNVVRKHMTLHTDKAVQRKDAAQ